jgi:hypothetical protein
VRAGADSRGNPNRMGARGDMCRLFIAQSAVVLCVVANLRLPKNPEPARADDVRSSVYLSARGKSAGFVCTQAGKMTSTWGVSIG